MTPRASHVWTAASEHRPLHPSKEHPVTTPTRAQIDAAKARQTAMRRVAQMHREAARHAAEQRAVRHEAERIAAAELRAEAAKPKGTTLADIVGYPTLAERDQALALQRNRKA